MRRISPIRGNFGILFLSDKVNSIENITLVNNENIEPNENEQAKTFYDVFSNIAKNHKILVYQCEDDLQ